jgi:valyl-tRNA synthetase
LRFVSERGDAPVESVASAILPEAQVILPMAGLFDADAERAKLDKDLAQARADVARLEDQLANEKFTSSAPPAVVAQARERLGAAQSQLAGLQSRLAELA